MSCETLRMRSLWQTPRGQFEIAISSLTLSVWFFKIQSRWRPRRFGGGSLRRRPVLQAYSSREDVRFEPSPNDRRKRKAAGVFLNFVMSSKTTNNSQQKQESSPPFLCYNISPVFVYYYCTTFFLVLVLDAIRAREKRQKRSHNVMPSRFQPSYGKALTQIRSH